MKSKKNRLTRRPYEEINVKIMLSTAAVPLRSQHERIAISFFVSDTVKVHGY